jgi:hypothetical protein
MAQLQNESIFSGLVSKIVLLEEISDHDPLYGKLVREESGILMLQRPIRLFVPGRHDAYNLITSNTNNSPIRLRARYSSQYIVPVASVKRITPFDMQSKYHRIDHDISEAIGFDYN